MLNMSKIGTEEASRYPNNERASTVLLMGCGWLGQALAKPLLTSGRHVIGTTTTPENVTALLKSTLGKDSPGWFAVIGAGDIVPAKKPAPDIYLWVLEQLGLPAQHCIALEDSENGLRAALAAGLDTVITVSDYTRGQDFSGATLVLSDLGEPAQPFAVLAGNAHGRGWVDAGCWPG